MITISLAAGQAISTSDHVLICPIFNGDRGLNQMSGLDEQFAGELSTLASSEAFEGGEGSMLATATLGRLTSPFLLLVGVGGDDRDLDAVRRGFADAARIALKRRAESATIAGDEMQSNPNLLEAALEGFLLGSYRYTEHFGSVRAAERTAVEPAVALVVSASEQATSRLLERVDARVRAVYMARDLVQMPANALNPLVMATRASEVAATTGLDIEILDLAALESLGAGAIAAVGKGSTSPPCLIHLTYRPGGEITGPPIGLVGKCITFDTGGYSIKTGEGMLQMKTDMAGGAAVLGAMSALRALGVTREVHGVICAAENMISGDAFRPGDVLTALNGVTIEITSTDAEGRLVLADGLVYTARQGVESMIDLATLTGAASVALADTAALFANQDALANILLTSASAAGERLWRMPLERAYRPRLKGEIADLKNTGGRPGGAIIAALFLEYFCEDVAWAHLDIAGAARSERAQGYLPQGGTGYGVRTLLNLLTTPVQASY